MPFLRTPSTHGQVSQYLGDELLPRRTHQKRQRPADSDQPLSQAQRPHQGTAGRQEPAQDRCAHRLWQERAAAPGN